LSADKLIKNSRRVRFGYIQRKIICYFEVQKNLRISLNLFFTGGEPTRQMPPPAATSFAKKANKPDPQNLSGLACLQC